MLSCKRIVIVLHIIRFVMSSNIEVPKKLLNDGRLMPAIALGTFLGIDRNGPVCAKQMNQSEIIVKAINVGYRHIDTATIYNNEDEIGAGIYTSISEGVVNRDELFLTTKLWNTHHRREQVLTALQQSLSLLRTNYVDLYLMHWPIGLDENNVESDVDYMETWRGMEDAVRLNLVKTIGVSNFNMEQLKRVLREGSIKPAVIQIEVHIQNVQKELVSFAQSEGLVVMGFSPFASLVYRYGRMFPGPKMDDPSLSAIAKKYGKTTFQVVLRWLVDRNIVPMPKTVNKDRMEENINIFDFTLDKDEIEEINQFDTSTRYTLPSFWQNHPYYPFQKIPKPVPNPFHLI